MYIYIGTGVREFTRKWQTRKKGRETLQIIDDGNSERERKEKMNIPEHSRLRGVHLDT
jgi:hypothetical protein